MMKNRFYYFITILSLLFCIFLLSGCQLAKETYSTVKDDDELCGVFVTFGETEQNNSLINEITLNSNGDVTINPKNLIASNDNKVDGVVNSDGSCIFRDIKGYFMGLYLTTVEPNGEDAIGMIAAKEFQDSQSSYKVTDTSEENSCEATLYVTRDINEVAHLNPVYRRADGTYYTMIGQNIGIKIDGSQAGHSSSQKIDQTNTFTNDGVTKSKKVSLEVNFFVVDEVKQILIKEMNEKDGLVKTTQLQPDDPDKFVVNKATSYVIVEEYLNNLTNGNYVKRSIYSLNSQNTDSEEIHHTIFLSTENIVAGIKELQFSYE